MSDRRIIGDWYTFCDICGRRCLASETTKLETYTGRGDLIVCKYDTDQIDPGLIPYRIPVEKNIPWARINHSNTSNGSPLVDLENMSLQYYIVASQDGAYIVSSQDNDKIVGSIPL